VLGNKALDQYAGEIQAAIAGQRFDLAAEFRETGRAYVGTAGFRVCTARSSPV
jgi:hypothetical protein